MTAARTETALIVLVNGGALALLAWLGLQGRLLPVFEDPLLMTPALAAAVLAAVVLSWVRFAQVSHVTGDDTCRHLKGLHQLRDALPYAGLICTTVALIAAFMSFGGHHTTPGGATTSALLWDIGWALRNTAIGLIGGGLVWLNAHLLDVAEDKLYAAGGR